MSPQDRAKKSPEKRNRESGIRNTGAVPWGTHLCYFYETKQDLIDILVPYFKAGLENNEFCIWVTSEYLNEEEAEKAIRKAVPDSAQYLERGQIEIIPHTEWYLKDGVFNGQRVINAWIGKLESALAKGYEGMRVAGDTDWVGKRYWKKFTDYERQVHNRIGENRMIALCAYSLGRFGASGVINILSKHQCVLTTQIGDWVLTRSSECKRAEKRRGMNSQAKSRGNMTPLQERFVRSGFEGYKDQEIIELLLSLVLSPRESKRLAKKCIDEFQNLRGFLSVSSQELQRVGISSSCMFCIKLLHELPTEVLKQKILEKPVYKSPQEILDYLFYSMRDLKKEVFKVVYLNNRNQIIDTIDLFEGTLDSIPIRPREIVDSAIKRNASALIFVHNHPTGDPTPSKTDKQLTRDLVFVGMILQIKVLDHIIIGENKYSSFAESGLIQKYEDDFLTMKIRDMSDIGVCLHG